MVADVDGLCDKVLIMQYCVGVECWTVCDDDTDGKVCSSEFSLTSYHRGVSFSPGEMWLNGGHHLTYLSSFNWSDGQHLFDNIVIQRNLLADGCTSSDRFQEVHIALDVVFIQPWDRTVRRGDEMWCNLHTHVWKFRIQSASIRLLIIHKTFHSYLLWDLLKLVHNETNNSKTIFY